ncbi:MAG: DMT family transporter, partial [Solimonas sp.]
AAGLICGLMPLVTALGAALLLGEPLRRAAIAGFALGLAGVLLVVGPGLHAGSLLGYGSMALALLSLSLGTLYQKRHASALDPRLALLAQLGASLLVMLPFAWGLEGLAVHPSAQMLGGTAWLILVNSCAGLLLYLWLLASGGAGRVASLFYLVPPVTAVFAALVLQARFGWHDALGFALAAGGVWLGQRGG